MDAKNQPTGSGKGALYVAWVESSVEPEQMWFHALHGLHDENHHQHHDPLHVCVPLVAGKLQGRAADEIERLREAVESLWGELPVESVTWLKEKVPDVFALCQQIHHDLWHATTHEERMVRRER